MIVTNGVGAPTTLEEASIGVNTGTGSRISLNGIRPLPVSPRCQTGPGFLLSTSWGRVPETRAVATPAFQLPQAELAAAPWSGVSPRGRGSTGGDTDAGEIGPCIQLLSATTPQKTVPENDVSVVFASKMEDWSLFGADDQVIMDRFPGQSAFK